MDSTGQLTNRAGERPGTPAFEVVPGSPKAGILLICDHASNRIPEEFEGLGLRPGDLGLHVAVDIGASRLTRALARRLDLPAVMTTTSRLVIDCNRAPGHPASIPAESHGVIVPGNQHLTAEERARRERTYFQPYHDAVGRELAAMEARGIAPALVSIHSFTPVLADMTRPWHVGILSDADRRLAELFLAALRAESGLVVGDNEPYSGRHPEGYSCPAHGDACGRPNVLIEVRQDLLTDDVGIDAWTERLGRILESLILGGLRGKAAAGAPQGGAMTPPVQAA